MKFTGLNLSVGVVVAGVLMGGQGVVGQDSASATSSAAAATNTIISTALIPSGISTTCSSFLAGLNSDSSFSSCISPLSQLTSSFNPSTGTPSESVTSTTITSTLTPLCASSAKCSDNLIRSYLGQFYSSCEGELTPGASGYSGTVRELYDYLYVVNPFRAAVCARDGGSQKYCVLEIAQQAAQVAAGVSTGSGAGANSTAPAGNATSAIKVNSLAATSADGSFNLFGPVLTAAENLVIYTPIAALRRRLFPTTLEARQSGGAAQQTIMTPNATTYRTTSLPYLFLQPNMSSSLLCTTCTRSVLAAYIAWESQTPYALGLSSSPILGAQQTLWNAVQGTCGSNFTEGIMSAAGVLASNATGVATGAAGRGVEMGITGVVGGLVVAAGASLFAGLI